MIRRCAQEHWRIQPAEQTIGLIVTLHHDGTFRMPQHCMMSERV
jgi:hypothetical protein